MNNTLIKEKISTPKKEHKKLKIFKENAVKFILCFLVSRAELFFETAPFGPAVMLATGGSAVSYIASMLGYFTLGNFEGLFYTTVVYIMKIFLKKDKADCPILYASGSIVYASIILQGGFLPYSVILRFISVITTVFSYFALKKAYKAQFVKSPLLKFTKKEGYCSLLLLFTVIMGIKSENIIYFLNISDIIKVYIIAASAYLTGIGGGAAIGSILGILSGNSNITNAVTMSVYSMIGFFSGIFAKFTKFTAVLGIFSAYIFACIYIETVADAIKYTDIFIAGILFLVTPSRKLKNYFNRYTSEEKPKDMMSTVNSITASRLEKLANSFTGLSNEISTIKPEKSLIGLNYNSMFDFLSDNVCGKCTLKNICWQKEYAKTVESLTKAVTRLEKTGKITQESFDSIFSGRCPKVNEIVISCKNFYDILKVNAVWKNKMNENTRAYKQQFVEMSKIICELKKNIETNKYFEAELSGELYGVLTEEGYLVKEVIVIKDTTETFYSKIILFKCLGGENCITRIVKLAEDVLGVKMVKIDGGCGETECVLFLREGEAGTLEKRVHSIPKISDEPVGDSYRISLISPNKYLVALCDGMGSGKDAAHISESVINLTEEMLKAGFSEESTYKMINSFILTNLSSRGFSTMDFMVIDTKNMIGKIVKNGACPTYIRRSTGDVTTVETTSLPVGIKEQKPFIKTVPLTKNDIVVMFSDGMLEPFSDKDWIKKILSKTTDKSLSETVDFLCTVARKELPVQEDDITILGVKIA